MAQVDSNDSNDSNNDNTTSCCQCQQDKTWLQMATLKTCCKCDKTLKLTERFCNKCNFKYIFNDLADTSFCQDCKDELLKESIEEEWSNVMMNREVMMEVIDEKMTHLDVQGDTLCMECGVWCLNINWIESNVLDTDYPVCNDCFRKSNQSVNKICLHCLRVLHKTLLYEGLCDICNEKFAKESEINYYKNFGSPEGNEFNDCWGGTP